MSDIERVILAHIGEHGEIADSGSFAGSQTVEHVLLVGVIKSLESAEMVQVQVRDFFPSRCLLQVFFRQSFSRVCFARS